MEQIEPALPSRKPTGKRGLPAKKPIQEVQLNAKLPETPALTRLRKPRANERLLSMNGSPIVNSSDNDPAGIDHNEEDEDEEDAGHLDQTFRLDMPRRITTKPGADSSIINIPLDDGTTILEIDSMSSVALEGLEEDKKRQVAERIRAMQDQLSRLLSTIE
jgi:hypothetical protein